MSKTAIRHRPESQILLAVVRRLKTPTPISDGIVAKYGCHREHWEGWLREYEGPGYYGRSKKKTPRTARFIYEHLHCAPMLIWLAELAGLPASILKNAASRSGADQPTYKDGPASARLVREVLPWELVLDYLRLRSCQAKSLTS